MLQHSWAKNRCCQLSCVGKWAKKYLPSKETICPRQPDFVWGIGVSANPGVNLTLKILKTIWVEVCMKVSLQSSDRYFLKKVLSNHQLDHSLGLGKKIITTNFSVARGLWPSLNAPNSQGVNKVSCSAFHFRQSCS